MTAPVFTAVFPGHLPDLPTPPILTETPWGRPLAVTSGDAIIDASRDEGRAAVQNETVERIAGWLESISGDDQELRLQLAARIRQRFTLYRNEAAP